MVKSIIQEMTDRSTYLEGQQIETIYFGGGTPSLLSLAEIATLLEQIQQTFRVTSNPEITLEANPDDIDESYVQGLWQLGINRLSLGIQTFDDDLLKFLHRAHTGNEAMTAIELARNAGFDQLTLDLIYGIPGSTEKILAKDLQHFLDIDPGHISAYSLTIEEDTVFGRWEKQGKLPAIPDEHAISQYTQMKTAFENQGYEQYEISNFCSPDRYSKHNSNYWKGTHYLGVGPGAHSYNGTSRTANIENNPKYIEALELGKSYSQSETLDKTSKINEYLMTTLRTKWGTDLELLKSDLGHDLLSISKDSLSEAEKLGWCIVRDHRLFLTEKGKLFADEFASWLFL